MDEPQTPDGASIRIPDTLRGYTVVPNGLLPEGKISARAWGFYVYLLSRPPGWHCRPRHLATVFREGRDATYSALRELAAHGLMERETYRDDGGMPRQRYVLVGEPTRPPDTESQDPGNPDPENPDALVTTDGSHSTPLPPKGGDVGAVADRIAASIGRVRGNDAEGTPVLFPVGNVGDACDNGNMSMTEATPSRRRREASDADAYFARFWALYPRKLSKGAARKAWPKAVDRARSPEVLIEGLERFVAQVDRQKRADQAEGKGRKTLQFVPYPATWLNQERWTDDPADAAASTSSTIGRGMPKAGSPEECPLHHGEWATNCRACASERLARED